jgi:hypothetical protein
MGTRWDPPIELSKTEKAIVKRCGKRRVYIFLRELRHRIFDEEMQGHLEAAYSPVERGKQRVPPAQLAMASLLQAALDVPDHEVVAATVMDRRWQMVLDCLDVEDTPFSQGTFFNFRQRAIEHGLDRVLFEKTIALARETGGFSAKRLRAAFDASPLWGAGRVEDTFNLIGRAVLHVLRSAAVRVGKSVEEVAEVAGIPLAVAPSIKAGLDVDWDDPNARHQALEQLLGQVQSFGHWLETELREQCRKPPLKDQWALVQKLIDQDTEPDPEGGGRHIKRGVAKDRQISISDSEMRHGRKSKRRRVDGYKRHVAIDLDTPGIVCAVAVTPANQPERVAAVNLLEGVEQGGNEIAELYIDRGYLGDPSIEERREQGTNVYCKPYPLRNRGLFHKGHFNLDLETMTLTCPNEVVVPFRLGRAARFPAAECAACPKRDKCTRAQLKRGRSVSIHPKEPFLHQLRQDAKTPDGRKRLRRRVKAEHSLAALQNRQGPRARYRGTRKNLYDLRRHAALTNLSVADHLRRAA